MLADYLSYDFDTQEIHGHGNVLLRQGNDFVTGPELTYKRDTETGVRVAAIRDRARQCARRRRPAHVRGTDPVRGCSRSRDHVRSAARGLVPARGADRHRHREEVGMARDARLDFMGVPVLYSPCLEFPLSNDRKSGFLTPTFGSSGTRGIDLRAAVLLQPRAELRRHGDPRS